MLTKAHFLIVFFLSSKYRSLKFSASSLRKYRGPAGEASYYFSQSKFAIDTEFPGEFPLPVGLAPAFGSDLFADSTEQGNTTTVAPPTVDGDVGTDYIAPFRRKT